jgi:hypothetical protein
MCRVSSFHTTVAIPVQVLHRKTILNAYMRALRAGEEALDPVGVAAILGLVRQAAVHAPKDPQPDEVVV